MTRLFTALMSLFLLASPAMAEPRAELIMIEQAGCAYCRLWNRQIAPIYPKTDVGTAAPLRRIDLHDPLPDDIAFVRGFNFTPTFVIVVDGAEYSRIEGYPGEDFFWGLLERDLAELGLVEPETSG